MTSVASAGVIIGIHEPQDLEDTCTVDARGLVQLLGQLADEVGQDISTHDQAAGRIGQDQ